MNHNYGFWINKTKFNYKNRIFIDHMMCLLVAQTFIGIDLSRGYYSPSCLCFGTKMVY